MKRKSLSIIIALAMLVSLMTVTGISASAEMTYTETWAIDVTTGDKVPGISDSASNLRVLIDHALGVPDAFDYSNPLSTSDNNKITSLRYFQYFDFTFDDILVNNADPAVYDLALYEATVGAWHPEAVKVTLLNAKVNGVVEPEYEVGVALNSVGNMLRELGALTGTEFANQTCVVSGNTAYTCIFFPDEVESAEAVRLTDVTANYATTAYPHPTTGKLEYKVNGAYYKFATFNAQKDGFDLDAIGGWIGEEIVVAGTVEGMNFHDRNSNGDFEEPAEEYIGGFGFQLFKHDGTDYVPISPADASEDLDSDGIKDTSVVTSTPDGYIGFYDVAPGDYLVKQIYTIPDWTQTNYFAGFRAVVDTNGLTTYYNELGTSMSDPLFRPHVGEVTCFHYSDAETAWAGWVFDKVNFPRYNKDPNANFDGVFRNGFSNWSMVVEFNGTEKTVDLVRGQDTDVGNVTITDNGDDTLNVAISVPADLGIMEVIHAGVFASVADSAMAPGQFTFKEKHNYTDFDFNLSYTTGETVYVAIHTQVAMVIPMP